MHIIIFLTTKKYCIIYLLISAVWGPKARIEIGGNARAQIRQHSDAQTSQPRNISLYIARCFNTAQAHFTLSLYLAHSLTACSTNHTLCHSSGALLMILMMTFSSSLTAKRCFFLFICPQNRIQSLSITDNPLHNAPRARACCQFVTWQRSYNRSKHNHNLCVLRKYFFIISFKTIFKTSWGECKPAIK